MNLITSQTAWYLTRATGAVSLLLFTAAVVLGVMNVQRFTSQRWPRFVIDGVHRRVSLLAITFLGIHVVTTVIDTFVSIPLIDAFIPFIGSYRPFWLGLGAVALDLALAIVITSLARDRIGFRAWRAVHWLTYACWPIAVVHGLGTGSDASSTWLLALTALCVVAVAAAVIWRITRAPHASRNERVAGALGLGGFLVFLIAWLPGGPLGPEWAKRSGTPAPKSASATPATQPAAPATSTATPETQGESAGSSQGASPESPSGQGAGEAQQAPSEPQQQGQGEAQQQNQSEAPAEGGEPK